MNSLSKLLPCEGEVSRSAETEGFFTVFPVEQVKERLCSAENPSVSLREPPSLGKGRSFYSVTFTHLRLLYRAQAAMPVSLSNTQQCPIS